MQQTIEGFRLSPQQIRLWSLQQQNESYRSYCSLSIEGHLHVSWLKQALETVFAREEMYRTCFKRLPAIKTPIQVVHDLPSSTWKQIDIRSCTPTEQQRLLTETAQSGLHYPFNLQEGPFSLCTLLILDEQKYVLFIHLHAIYADMATLHNLTKELAHLYHSYGLSIEQNSEVAQYAQFSEWQNALLEEEGETTDQERWQKKDFPTPSAFSLPFESKAPEQNSFSPTFLTVSIDQTLYTQIETLLTRSHSHMADFLLTCWQILLWRLTGRDDMLIGLGVTGRTYEDLTDIAGLIAKYMPFLGHLDDILTFDALLNQTHETCSELLSLYPYFSWEHLKPSTSSAINALQYPFSFDFSTQPATLVVGDISFSPRQCYCCSEPFKLKMVAVQGTADLTIEFHYDLHLFDTRDIQRLALQFTTLLKSCVQQPDARISHLDMVSHDELQQLLVTFNQTQADYPKELCVHHLFEQQVASSPDAIAVYDGDMLLTYEQLDAYANRLARHLLAIGVQPEVLIGVCLERSTALLISILGIMKSGGVYVPLDPVQPKSRLSSLVSEAALSFLLTDHNLIDHMPKIKHVVYLDADWHSLIQQSGKSVPIHNPAQLAYVLYTSGSTGQPKGVMISHQGLTHYVNWCSQQYAVASGTGAPVHSSLAFDLTVTSLFAPLVVGRSVFLVPEGKGIDELSNTLRAGHDFSLVKITPAHLDLLNQQLPHEELAHIAHALIIGGEALKGESLVAWHRYAPETRLINEYGPTETVVGCCIYEVPHTYPLTGNIPIGRPIPNTQIYLLDAQMSPVPLGVSGELYIGGCALGRGYLNRADLTAASFVPHPFSTEPGARLYKTGDLARYITADGDLEYLGRCDHQVKLRGYRIELEEIEVVLSLHPSIRECVTLLREDTPGDQRLVAYIVGKQPTLPTLIDSLRGYLQQQLPHYMIPTAFVVLDALPLTANGKVDRRALPAPDVRQGELTKKWIAPQTAIQELLSELWCEVLGSSHANVYDDFFKVGGHSLLATQFIARIQAVLQVEIPVRTIFEKPTIVELSQHVEQALHNGQITVAPPLVPVARMQHMPLSFAQQRLWFLHQLNKHSTAYLVPQARYLYGSLHVETLERCLTELVSRHESLRTTFIAQAGQPTQIIHPASNHYLPVIDLRNLHQDEGRHVAWQLAAQEAQSPCDLERGPLFRTHLVRLADNEHVLLITLHHIITDGWSNKVLARELISVYRAFLAGQPSPLTPLSIQYADYAHWQQQWLQGEVLETQLDYWTQQLGGAPPIILPADYPHPPIPASSGAVYNFTLSKDLSQALVDFSRQEGVTLFMTLLAAFQVLFYRSTGQTDIVIGTDSANRSRVETESIIGFFINLLALRTNLSGKPSFREVLKRVREVMLGAYTYQHTPFDLLVEKLAASSQHLDRMPLIQVLFVLQNLPAISEKFAHMVSLNEQENANRPPSFQQPTDEITTAKFDLALFMQEHAGQIYGSLNYRLDLFKTSTITTMMTHFEVLLHHSIKQPDISIDLLAISSAAELAQHKQKEQQIQQELRATTNTWLDLPTIDFN